MSNKIENTWDCLVEPPTVNSFLLLLVLYGGSISDSLYCIAEAGLVNLLIDLDDSEEASPCTFSAPHSFSGIWVSSHRNFSFSTVL